MERTCQKLSYGPTNLFVSIGDKSYLMEQQIYLYRSVTSLCIFEISLRKGSFEWVI